MESIPNSDLVSYISVLHANGKKNNSNNKMVVKKKERRRIEFKSDKHELWKKVQKILTELFFQIYF